MAAEKFDARLRAAAELLDVSLSEVQCETLLTYLAQMQRWNRTYNLTALRDFEQMLVQHVFDSLAVVKPMRNWLSGTATNQPVIADIGSGAGLPGIVLAVSNPAWRITCVDAVEKKMAFVRQMGSVLRLANLNAQHARVETLDIRNADVVVSRAFASLLDFTNLAGRHVAAHGRLLAMKGRQPDEEIAALEAAGDWKVESIEPLTVPELDAQRCLVWMSRQGKL